MTGREERQLARTRNDSISFSFSPVRPHFGRTFGRRKIVERGGEGAGEKVSQMSYAGLPRFLLLLPSLPSLALSVCLYRSQFIIYSNLVFPGRANNNDNHEDRRERKKLNKGTTTTITS